MPEPQLGTLLVSCPDQKGIVATLAQLLYSHGANIVDADQHTDPIAGMFFQRIRFDLATAQTDRARLEASLAEVRERFELEWRLVLESEQPLPRVAVYCSK